MSIEQVKLPDVDGEEVEVIELCVKVGDEVEEDDALIVVETQKASMDVPSPFKGKISSLHVKEGDKIGEGALICEISQEGTSLKTDEKKPQTTDESKETEPKIQNKKVNNEQIIDYKKIRKVIEDIYVPDLGEDGEVDVIEVLVSVGDSVDYEDGLMTLETQKATMDVPATCGGVIKEFYIKAGDKVKTGTLIGKIEKEVVEFLEIPKEKPAPKEEIKTPSKPETFVNTGKVYASPSVRKLADEFGVNLSLVKGKGRKGRILKEDITSFIKQSLSGVGKSSPTQDLGFNLPPTKEVDFSKFGEIETVELSRIQKISGPNLHKNYLSAPHITQFDECDITELEKFRKEQNAINAKKQTGVKFSPLVFVLKAVAKTLQVYPKFNTSLSGENLIYKKYIHIGVAVDTPNGLVVPVIKDVDKKGFTQLANELKEISQKARDGKLKMQDMQGGCFTISSLGGIGGTYFTPIINAPEVAILGLSKSQMKPVWNGSEFMPRLMLSLSLSYDHKVIDGADGARFVSTLSQFLEDIKTILL